MRAAMWKIAILSLLCGQALANGTLPAPHIPGCTNITDDAELIARSCARVYPLPGINADFPALLKLEDKARAEKTGLWADPEFAIRTPETARQLLDSYGIVEGTITAAAKAKGQIYLNFGPAVKDGWKTDFTVELTNDAAKQLLARDIDWQTLAGRHIRVRGWVFWRFGPAMMVTSDAQVEVL